MDIPPDLLQLRVDFLRADQRCTDLAKAIPSNWAILKGEIKMTKELATQLVEQDKELRAARAARMAIVMKLDKHEWLRNLPESDRAAARKALQEAALEALAVNA